MHNIWYTSEEENSTVKIWISQKEWISSSSGSDVVVPSCWWKQDMVSGSSQVLHHQVPTASVYGISTYTYHKNQPNVGKCTIHWSYGKRIVIINHIYIHIHIMPFRTKLELCNWRFQTSNSLKNVRQIGSFPQIGVKIKKCWNHHLEKWSDPSQYK